MKINYNLFKSEDVSNFILGLIFVFPILPFNFVSFLIIALVIAGVLEKIIYKDFKVDKNKANLIFSSIFFLLLISTITYSDNLKDGIKEIQKSIPFFLFPLIFFLKNKLSIIWLKRYLLIFVFANFVFIVFLYKYFLSNFFLGCHYEMSLLPNYIKIQYLYNRPFSELMWCSEKAGESVLFIHKVYNSMCLLFCNMSIIYLLYQFKFRNWMRFFLAILFILFSFMIINMVSVVNLFLFLAMFLVLLFLTIRQLNRNYLKWSFFAITLLACLVLYVKKDSIRFITKEVEWISNEQETTTSNNISAKNILQSRYYVNACSIEIIKQNLIFGVGIGDVQDFQNKCYLEKAKNIEIFNSIYQNNLNAHNQYFSYLMAGGVPLLIAFLFMLLTNIRKEYLRRNYLFMSFLILIISNLIFESMFTRMYGIIFFSLMGSLLTKHFYNENINDRT